jgi:hypothetical protein
VGSAPYQVAGQEPPTDAGAATAPP